MKFQQAQLALTPGNKVMNAPDLHHRATLDPQLDRLRNAQSFSIGEFIQQPIYDRYKFQGVYAISPPDSDAPVYVGKTNDGKKENALVDEFTATFPPIPV